MALMSRTITAGTSRKLVNVNLILSESHPDDYISNNYSRINYSVTITRGDKTWDTSWSGWGTKIYFYFSIGGNNYGPIYVPKYNHGGNNPPGTTFASGYVDIAHNNDGTKSIDASISFTDTANGSNNGKYYTPGNGSASASGLVLETIPRASSISAPASLTTGTTARLSITRASSSFTHYLYWKIGSVTGEIASNVSESYEWTPAHSIFTNYPNNASNCDITIVCDTYSGGTFIGQKMVNTKINLASSVKPTISGVSISDGNSEVSAKNWAIYLKGKSYIQTNMTGSGVHSSTISTYGCIMEGVTYEYSSLNELNMRLKTVALVAGSRSVKLYVKDSRGRKSSETTKSYTVVDYQSPTLTVNTVERCTSNGTPSDSGTYLKVSFSGGISSCNSKNKITLKVAYKKQSASSYPSGNYVTYYNNVTTPVSFDFTGSNSKIFGSGNISTSSTWDILVQISDAFTTNERTKQIGTEFDLIHFNKSGKSIAFGKKSEASENESKAEFGFDVDMKGALYIKGNDLQNVIKKVVLDTYFPVGSLYLTVGSEDPNTTIGGTWSKLSGYYLYADTSINNTSYTGKNTQNHILTESQIPSHTHTIQRNGNYSNGFMIDTGKKGNWGSTITQVDSNNYTAEPRYDILIDKTGGGQAHSHNIATKGIYVWQRTK